MKLRELDGQFLGRIAQDGHQYGRVETLGEAQGVLFQCPKCSIGKERAPDGGFVGAHYVIVPFRDRGVPDAFMPKMARWDVASGAGLDDLTTKPSILIIGACEWHGFITNGDAA